MEGFNEIREAMLDNASLAAAAADDEGEGVEWAIVAGKGIEGLARPLVGGDSGITEGVG